MTTGRINQVSFLGQLFVHSILEIPALASGKSKIYMLIKLESEPKPSFEFF